MSSDDREILTGLRALQIRARYRTGSSNPVRDFYRPCLLSARVYDRAVGFFRSTVYLIIGEATIEFARRGGKIRIVCSPSLDFADIQSIDAAYDDRVARVDFALQAEIEALSAGSDDEYRTRVLATLVRAGCLDFRIAIRPEAFGLYHEKIGVFKDGVGSSISFIGSANETWSAWHREGNFESIEVFCSWNGPREASRVAAHISDFEALWTGTAPDVLVTSFPEAAKRNLLQRALPSLDDVDTNRLIGRSRPRTNVERLLQPHQQHALAAWHAADRRGILEHATGSGKTFTAIAAIKEHVACGRSVLILVPSRLLLEQWALEIRQELPDATFLVAGAGHGRWRLPRRLKSMTAPDAALGGRIVLATMQTAATDEFLANVEQGDHLMLVADEVHQLGSLFNSRVLKLNTGPRLGLSATPHRYGDTYGTEKIMTYFHGVVPPPVTLKDAIAAGRLVEYEYFPHPVRLTPQEAEDWRAISRAIAQETSRNQAADGSTVLSERAKLLLIQRARIAKKAINKVTLAVRLLRRLYRPHQRWLVYCDDNSQLQAIRSALDAEGLRSSEYHSSMEGDRDAALNWFKTFGGILVSIRCLDEGVDIPAVSHAIILASSQNPRQFIQRRGRVLRAAPGKTLAIIHDAIVVPVSLEDEPEQLALLKAEFIRAVQFANDAINRSAAAELRSIAAEIGFDPDAYSDDAMEEEEEWQTM